MESAKSIAGLFIIILLAWLSSAPHEAHPADFLTASGCSVSNVGYLTDLAAEYERRTGVKVFVRGGGSAVGIEDLRNGKVDFAASCRSRQEGDPEDVTFTQVAWDALVFIVHPSNPLENISLDAVRSIYAGRTTNWKQLKGRDAPVRVFISRATKGLSGVESSLRKLVLKDREIVKTPSTYFLASTGIVEQMVAETPEWFAATGFSSARKRPVKMLKVDGVPPTTAAIIRNRYPLKRPLFILTPGNPKEEVKRFVDFALSREGQQYIRSLNVVTLQDVP